MPERKGDQLQISLPITDDSLRMLFEKAYEEKLVFDASDSILHSLSHPEFDLDEAFDPDPHFIY